MAEQDQRLAALAKAMDAGADYLRSVDEDPAFPQRSADELRSAIDVPLTDEPLDPLKVIDELDAAVRPGLTAVAGSRYFGFVTGGSLPAAMAADLLAVIWDQNAFSYVGSPAGTLVEAQALTWIKELLGLPEAASGAVVTGCQMAHVTSLAAARHAVLARHGWDVATDGLTGAPPVRVVTGRLRHVTVDRAIRLLGLGTRALHLVDVDDRGRMDLASLDAVLGDASAPTILVPQAGEVNTGGFDPLEGIIARGRECDAWVHVDGAFGIWAVTVPELAPLVRGIGDADSWAFDGHKWLNVPYDSGIAIVSDTEAHHHAMAGQAAYLHTDPDLRNPLEWTPDASRRARGFALYAALRSLGRQGVTDLVARCCALARCLGTGLAGIPGIEVLNDVVLNQVLIRMTDSETTTQALDAVQRRGVAWMGGTTWEGEPAIRLSISSWRTTEADIDLTIAEFASVVGG